MLSTEQSDTIAPSSEVPEFETYRAEPPPAGSRQSASLWDKATFFLVAILFTLNLLRVGQGLVTGEPFGISLLNADTMYLPNLYQDWIEGQDLSQWKLPPAPFLFPEMFLYFLVKPFIPRFDIALATVSGIQLTSIALLLGQLFRWFAPKLNSWQSSTLGLIAVLVQCHLLLTLPLSTIWFRIYSPSLLVGFHVGSLVLTLAATCLLIQALEAPSSKARSLAWVSLGVTIALAMASDAIFLLQWLAPVGLALGFVQWKQGGGLTTVKHFGLAVGGGLLGMLGLQALLVKHPALAGHLFGHSIPKVIVAFWQDMQQLPLVFTGLGLFTAYAAIRFLVHKPESRAATTLSKQLVWGALFFLPFINIAGAILSGNYTPDSMQSCWRYLLPLSLFPIYGAVLLAWDKLVLPLWRLSRLSKTALLLVAAFAISLLHGPKPLNTELPRPMHASVDCINRYTEAYQLHRGLSTSYWAAKLPRMYLPGQGLQLMAIRPSKAGGYEPHWWINNRGWFKQPLDFLYVEKAPTDEWQGILADTELRFGEPEYKLPCEDGATIWIYRNNPAFRDQYLSNNTR